MKLKNKPCGVILAPGNSVNHLDHIAPISQFLNFPIYTDEELLIETTKKYYPQATPVFIKNKALICPSIVMGKYNFLFVSSSQYINNLTPYFNVTTKRKMYYWFCPHGHSDKNIEQFGHQEFIFYYGNLLHKRLAKEGYISNFLGMVRTGNYRLSFYQNNKSFYDRLVDKEIFSKFERKQKVILYAPTWIDTENSSSYVENGLKLIQQVPSHINLIVKLHPWLEGQKPAHVLQMEEISKNLKNVVVLSKYPLVYPILDRTDIYLGDFSSVGYDFLCYQRPMFFIDSPNRLNIREDSSFLHKCGTIVPVGKCNNIFHFIEQSILRGPCYSKIQRDLNDETFGDQKSGSEIKKDVTSVVNQF